MTDSSPKGNLSATPQSDVNAQAVANSEANVEIHADADAQAWLHRLREAGPAPQSRGGDLAGGPMPVDLIPGYEILAEIGRGGQGVVFRALQLQTSRMVALKLLHEGPLASAAAARRFQREIELSSSLDHEGILTVFDAGVSSDGRSYVISQIIEGQRLDQWLEDHHPDFESRIEVLLQVCRALEHAHQRGVIHLDLKPSNVMVTDAGHACILDFGLARLLEQSATETLSNGMTAGTPAYMAPEQISQHPHCWDTRTDVHALGGLLFQTLTEELPFLSDGSPLEVLQTIESAPPPSLRNRLRNQATPREGRSGNQSTLQKQCPTALAFTQLSSQRLRDLDAICTKAMAKEPELRYSSASQFAVDLQAMLDGNPVVARGMDRAYRWKLALRRNRPAIALTVASLMIAAWFAWSANLQKNLRADAVLSRDQARQAAIAFIDEVDPLIKILPGSAPARRRIVTRGLEFLKQLQSNVGDDAALAMSLAKGYFLIGNIQADIYSSSSGELHASVISYGKGLEFLQDIFGQEGKLMAEIHILQFELFRKRGQALRRLSRWSEFGIGVEGEMTIVDRLLALAPDDASHKRYLALALEDMGVWAEHEGRLKESLDLQLQSQAVLEELLGKAPEGQLLARDLAVGYFKIGNSLRALGRLNEARDMFLKFLEAAPAGDDLISKTDRAVAHEWVGRIESSLGNSDAALSHLAAAVAILEPLVAEHRDNLSLRTSLATILNHSGEVHLENGQLKLAKAAFERFNQAAVALVENFPEVPRNHRMLGVSYYKMYEWHVAYADVDPARTGAFSLAHSALEQCISVFETMQIENLLAPEDAGVIDELRGELAGLKK